MTTVDHKITPRQERAGVANEEQRRALELVWVRQRFHHDLVDPQLLEVRLLFEVLYKLRGLYIALLYN
jgi:hypothetical protein